MRLLLNWLFLALVLALVAFVAYPAFAQSPPTDSLIARTSVWFDIWTIVQPVVTLFVSIVGPVLVTWIAGRLIALLKVKDDAAKLEIEQRLRDALHQSAENAIDYAKAKLSRGAISFAREAVVNEALGYVLDKNPDAVKKLGVSEAAIADIILGKIIKKAEPPVQAEKT